MKRKFLICILAAAAVMSITGCHKKESKVNMIEYSDLIGAAEGTADFQSDGSLEINIKDIQSYVGQDIDYSSGIDIKNVDDYEDFQMWVDATGVDIYTAGKYTAAYKFVYGGQTLEKTVGVTILEKEEGGDSNAPAGGPGEAGGSLAGQSSSGNSVSAAAGNNSSGNASAGNSGNGADSPSGGEISAGNLSGVEENGNVSGDNSSGGNASEGNAGQSASNGNTPGGNAPNGNTTAGNREIITSTRSGTVKPSTIGYTNIELLSGRYVKIKCTSAKYIVSTRTDESQTVKNDKTYNVSKLIITYNTGAEQILETVEKAVN